MMRASALQRQLTTVIVLAGCTALAAVPRAEPTTRIEQGRQIAFDPTKGNCLACHQMEGGESPGDLGPPLVGMKARFPDKIGLRNQLWDPMERHPGSRMPPFGRHRILTEEELDRVVDYIYSL